MINLEDVIAALYDGTIGLEDIEEAYLNHELSNDDIDVINEAIDYIENQEAISEARDTMETFKKLTKKLTNNFSSSNKPITFNGNKIHTSVAKAYLNRFKKPIVKSLSTTAVNAYNKQTSKTKPIKSAISHYNRVISNSFNRS